MRLIPIVTTSGAQLWLNPELVRTVGPGGGEKAPYTKVYCHGTSSPISMEGAPEEVALKLQSPLEVDTMVAFLVTQGYTVTPPGQPAPPVVPFPQPPDVYQS